jgi:FkbM family methyltransferase
VSHRIAVIIGPNKGDRDMGRHVSNHDEYYCFEPMPDAAQWLSEKNQHPMIHVIEAACGIQTGRATMNMYNNGLSSSLGVCTEQAREVYAGCDLTHAGTLDVDVVNAYEYLTECGVKEITTLLTDAQGMDLAILKTMAPWLESKRIQVIICEADNNAFRHYDDLPSNQVADFDEFMHAFPWYRRVDDYPPDTANPNLKWNLE